MQYLDRLAWRLYGKPRLEFNRSINTKDYVKITVDQEYVETISDIRYRWKPVDLTRPKALAKSQSRNGTWQ